MRSDFYYDYNRFDVIDSKLNVTTSEKSIIDIDDINRVIKRFDISSISFSNIVNIQTIKDIINFSRNSGFKGQIIIDMGSWNNKINMSICNRIGIYDVNSNSRPPIQGLDNKEYIDLNNIPSNLKFNNVFEGNHAQNEFTTWIHNLNDENKKKIYRLLDDDDKKAFEEEELLIKKICSEIIKKYPNILSLNKDEQFNTIFKYICDTYPFASEATDRNGYIAFNGHWAQDAIETYKRKRGVCEGRANLLTLATNNEVFRLNCTPVSGRCGIHAHVWNAYISNGSNVSYFDTSFRRTNATKQDLKESGYKIEKVYSIVSKIENLPPLPKRKEKIVPPLPPRKKKYINAPPLPKRNNKVNK